MEVYPVSLSKGKSDFKFHKLMKVHEIPVIRVLIKSYQNKAEKPTIKQSIKVLNIRVMAAIIKQDGMERS